MTVGSFSALLKAVNLFWCIFLLSVVSMSPLLSFECFDHCSINLHALGEIHLQPKFASVNEEFSDLGPCEQVQTQTLSQNPFPFGLLFFWLPVRHTFNENLNYLLILQQAHSWIGGMNMFLEVTINFTFFIASYVWESMLDEIRLTVCWEPSFRETSCYE